MTKRSPSIFSAIIRRQVYGSVARQDLDMIRKLIESDGEYKKVFEKSSKSPIVYDGNLFFDAYTACYDINGLEGRPRVLYHLRKPEGVGTGLVYGARRRISRFKVEALLVFECPLDQTSFDEVKGTAYEKGSYTIGLTSGNYLKTFDIKSGKVLETICVSCHRSFKYLSWETDWDRILVKSVLDQGSHRIPRHTQNEQALLYLAVLSVSPMRFLCVLPIYKHIFGADICNASVRNGLLVVVHAKGKMSFYSFDSILRHASVPLTLGDQVKQGNSFGLPELDNVTTGAVGRPPVGLPINVSLFERPCMLFEVTSDNSDLSLGGFPWHYISCKNQIFQIRSVKDHALAENGILESKVLSLGSDKAFFHHDLSGSILHIGPSTLCCYKLVPLQDQDHEKKYTLSKKFFLEYSQPKLLPSQTHVLTKSGRQVRQLFNSYHGDIMGEIIQDIDYDDELDVLVVLFHDQTTKGQGIVGFYDNQSGVALRKLAVGKLSEDGEHSVAVDRNILVVMSKDMSNFKCVVYYLLPNVR